MDFFNNESETIQIGDLTIENRKDRIEIYGSIPRSKEGMESTISLLSVIYPIIFRILNTPNLPDTLPVEGENVTVVENPFNK